MFKRILLRSLQRRWQRLAIAALAILLGSLLVAALSSLTLDLGSKVGKELRNYGANVVITPRAATLAVGSGALDFGTVAEERFLSEASLAALEDPVVAADLAGYVPYLYGIVSAGDQQVVLAGTWLDRVLSVSPWWNVAGSWLDPGDRQGVMIGSNVASQLRLAVGDPLTVRYGDRTLSLAVRAIVDTGASEDNQIFVNLPVAQALLDRPGQVALVQVSAITASRPLPAIAGRLEQLLPEAQAKIVGQIADAEAAVFFKIQLLMALVAALVLLAAALSVASTMTTTVLERTREIGLLKALGAGSGRIASLFLAETTAIGFVGGLLGYGFGLLVAQVIARSVFQAALTPHWLAVPVTIVVAVSVALLASILPVRRAVAIDPAVTLRGE
jgi:putative ABC transport system permease protein